MFHQTILSVQFEAFVSHYTKREMEYNAEKLFTNNTDDKLFVKSDYVLCETKNLQTGRIMYGGGL